MGSDETIAIARAPRPGRTGVRPIDIPLAVIAIVLALTVVGAAWPRDRAGAPTPTPAATQPSDTPAQLAPAPRGHERKEEGKPEGGAKGKD